MFLCDLRALSGSCIRKPDNAARSQRVGRKEDAVLLSTPLKLALMGQCPGLRPGQCPISANLRGLGFEACPPFLKPVCGSPDEPSCGQSAIQTARLHDSFQLADKPFGTVPRRWRILSRSSCASRPSSLSPALGPIKHSPFKHSKTISPMGFARQSLPAPSNAAPICQDPFRVRFAIYLDQ